MKDSILRTRSESFSIRIVKMKQYIQEKFHEYEMSKQVVRSGTSIGANIAEALCAQSSPDFIAKIHISLKEASETSHWLKTLHKTGYLTDSQFESIHHDCDELIRLLIHTLKKVKSR